VESECAVKGVMKGWTCVIDITNTVCRLRGLSTWGTEEDQRGEKVMSGIKTSSVNSF